MPRGALHQGLLDTALHAIPHDELHRWDPAIGSDRLAFPHRLSHLAVYDPLPDHGEIEVETRFASTLPGTTNAIYGLPAGARAAEWLPHIALKEHVIRTTGVHPSTGHAGSIGILA